MQEDKYNSLTRIGPNFRKPSGAYFARFRCDCGVEKDINVSCVKNGGTKSCGCKIYLWKDEVFYDDEEWKTVDIATNYEVSNYGKIRSKITGNIVKTFTNNKGYSQVTLNNNGKIVSSTAHRLVATAFVENINNESTVDHINRDRSDNRATNLRWSSHKQQSENRKSKEFAGKKVLMIDKDTNAVIKSFDSMYNAGMFFNKESGFKNISQCILGKVKTALGYKWKFDQTELLEGEIWKRYKDNMYISNLGRCRKNGYILTFEIEDQTSYLSTSHKGKHLSIHRLVAELFVLNPENKEIVNHKDGDIYNNAASNLEWVSRSENAKHAVRTGLIKRVKKIVHIDINGIETIYNSCKEAADILNTNASSINKCCKGRIRQLASGDKFRYL